MDLLSKIFERLGIAQRNIDPDSPYSGIDSHKWSSKITTIQRLSKKPTSPASPKATSSGSRLSG